MFHVSESDMNYWKDTLYNLITSNPTAQYLFYLMNHCDMEDLWVERGETTLGDITVNYGASKLVLISRQSDVVVKIPILHHYTTDYCAIESKMYSKAQESGLNDCFAGVIFGGRVRINTKVSLTDTIRFLRYGDIDCKEPPSSYHSNWIEELCEGIHSCEEDVKTTMITFDFYYGERMVEEFEDMTYSSCYYDSSNSEDKEDEEVVSEDEEIKEAVRTYRNFLDSSGRRSCDYGFNNPSIGSVFFKHYGQELFIKISDFINDNDINDIHTGNIMYDNNGRIRFIDYSGFYN